MLSIKVNNLDSIDDSIDLTVRIAIVQNNRERNNESADSKKIEFEI